MFQQKLLKILWTQDDPETICNQMKRQGLSKLNRDFDPKSDEWIFELTSELLKQWETWAK